MQEAKSCLTSRCFSSLLMQRHHVTPPIAERKQLKMFCPMNCNTIPGSFTITWRILIEGHILHSCHYLNCLSPTLVVMLMVTVSLLGCFESLQDGIGPLRRSSSAILEFIVLFDCVRCSEAASVKHQEASGLHTSFGTVQDRCPPTWME